MTGSKSQNLDSLTYPHYYNMPRSIQFSSCVLVALWHHVRFIRNEVPETSGDEGGHMGTNEI